MLKKHQNSFCTVPLLLMMLRISPRKCFPGQGTTWMHVVLVQIKQSKSILLFILQDSKTLHMWDSYTCNFSYTKTNFPDPSPAFGKMRLAFSAKRLSPHWWSLCKKFLQNKAFTSCGYHKMLAASYIVWESCIHICKLTRPKYLSHSCILWARPAPPPSSNDRITLDTTQNQIAGGSYGSLLLNCEQRSEILGYSNLRNQSKSKVRPLFDAKKQLGFTSVLRSVTCFNSWQQRHIGNHWPMGPGVFRKSDQRATSSQPHSYCW